MISDLLTLRTELLAASAGQEKSQKEHAYKTQVITEIHALFDDPKYPKRRRSFSVIRKRLGVFEPDDPELKGILFGIGARVYRGEGEDALWELPEGAQAMEDDVKPRRPVGMRLALFLVVIAVVLVIANTLLNNLLGASLLDALNGIIPSGQTLEQCLQAAAGAMEEMIECNIEHG